MIKSFELDLDNIDTGYKNEINDLELQIEKLQESINNSKTNYKTNYVNKIYDNALTYKKICDEKDNKINSLISDLDVSETSLPFNPITIVQIKNDQINLSFEHWNKDKGILPDRQVVDTYHITSKSKIYYCTEHDIVLDKAKQYAFSCGCNQKDKHVYKHTNCFGQDDKFKSSKYSFEVDNYLNLYDRKKNIYFLINSVPFPRTLFHFVKDRYVYSEGDVDEFKYYLDHITHALQFKNVCRVKSLIYKAFTEILPNNLQDVYQSFNKFRTEKIEDLQTTPKSNQTLEKVLTNFYQNSDNAERFAKLRSGEITKNLSLRQLNYFVTNYAKQHNIELVIEKKGKFEVFNVHENYRNCLKTYTPTYFDIVSRGDHTQWVIGTYNLNTTIGQLNFFKWLIEHQLDVYVAKNYQKILNKYMTWNYKNYNKTDNDDDESTKSSETVSEEKTSETVSEEKPIVLEDITNLVVRVDKDGNRTINVEDFEDVSEEHDCHHDVYLDDYFNSSEESDTNDFA